MIFGLSLRLQHRVEDIFAKNWEEIDGNYELRGGC